MLILSNNLRKHIEVPANAIIRINLAWYSCDELKKNVEAVENDIFFDWPSGRTKPPTNEHQISEIKNLAKVYKHIKYLGISNAESPNDVTPFVEMLSLQIVPKIESIVGIENAESILKALPYENKVIMLDHEDLYNDLLNNNVPPDHLYDVYVAKLNKYCNQNNTKVLKTAGIVFSDR
jgi:hypothetical protein